MTQLVTPEEFAKQICFNTKSIYQLAYRKSIPFVKIGDSKQSALRFRQEDVDQFINAHTHKSLSQQVGE